MFSPGQWHKGVPKQVDENIQFRLDLLNRARGDENFQRGVREICRQDILYYINSFVLQFNPKKPPRERVAPFVTWAFQERALLDRPETTGRKGIIWCYENNRSAVIEKSREMGASWLFLIFQDWLGLFHRNSQTLNISKSALAVDGKSPDSLFWKLRHMHAHLPDWLKVRPIIEEKMYIEYPATASVATGEASTKRAGVGGRASVIFIDEFSQIEEATEVRQRTAGTSDVRFFNGTHLGVGTEFYELTEDKSFVKIQMHWTRHPDKNKGLYSYDTFAHKLRYWEYVDETDQIKELRGPKYKYPADFEFVMDGTPTGGPHPGIRSPWYDAKVRDIGDERGAAMELDINARGAVSQFYNALMIRRLVQEFATEPLWEGDIDYDRETGEPLGLVVMKGGPLRLWLNLKEGKPPFGKYGAGTDVSAGTGATPSCLSIADSRTGEKVLEYANAHIDPKEFATLCVALCRLFQDEDGEGAKLVWENHGPGVPFGKRVWEELTYRNIFYKTAEHKLAKSVSDVPGWSPMGDARLKLHTDYKSALANCLYLNRSERALDECLAFKYTSNGSVEHSRTQNADPTAARENHGDMVVADALSWKMIKDLPRTARLKEAESVLDVRSLAGRRLARRQRKLEESWA